MMGTGGGAAGGAPGEGPGPPSLCRPASRLFLLQRQQPPFPGGLAGAALPLGSTHSRALTGLRLCGPDGHAEHLWWLRERRVGGGGVCSSRDVGWQTGSRSALVGLGSGSHGLSAGAWHHSPASGPSSAPGTAMPCRQEPEALLKDVWLGKKKNSVWATTFSEV